MDVLPYVQCEDFRASRVSRVSRYSATIGVKSWSVDITRVHFSPRCLLLGRRVGLGWSERIFDFMLAKATVWSLVVLSRVEERRGRG